MEEKLNMIYAKLLEIENSMNREKLETKLKVLEKQQKELNYQIDELKHTRIKVQEYNDELLARFRNIGNQMQVRESE